MEKVYRLIILLLVSLSFEGRGATPLPSLLPVDAPILDGYNHSDSIYDRLDSRRLLPLEGEWEMTADGATIVIERIDDFSRERSSCYNIVILDSPDRSIVPGTLIGRAVDSSDPSLYDAELYVKPGERGLTDAQNFSLRINDDGRLQLRSYNRGVWVNFWKFVPYLWRYVVGTYNQRPENLDGMIKVYPISIQQSGISL